MFRKPLQLSCTCQLISTARETKKYAFVNLVSSTAGEKFARHLSLKCFPPQAQGLRVAAEKHLRQEARVTNPYFQPFVWVNGTCKTLSRNIFGPRSGEISVFVTH